MAPGVVLNPECLQHLLEYIEGHPSRCLARHNSGHMLSPPSFDDEKCWRHYNRGQDGAVSGVEGLAARVFQKHVCRIYRIGTRSAQGRHKVRVAPGSPGPIQMDFASALRYDL